MENSGDEITEMWLKGVGFRWHQLERQLHKHWLLWIGEACGADTCFEDLGVEITPAWWFNADGERVGETRWNCWLRADSAGRYHRFIHVRYLRRHLDLIRLVEGLTGQEWDAGNNLFGIMRRPDRAARLKQEMNRLDIRNNITERPGYRKWQEIEKDDSRGRALPEHYEAHEKAKE